MKMQIGLFTFLALSALVTGCTKTPVKMTGGGQIIGTDAKANVGFNLHACDLNAVKGRFNFNDHTNDVRFNGEVVDGGLCSLIGGSPPPLCDFRCLVGEAQVSFTYRSTNPNAPGTGYGIACASDVDGNGFYNDDHLYVQIDSGPYAYYSIEGDIQGSFVEHPCDP